MLDFECMELFEQFLSGPRSNDPDQHNKQQDDTPLDRAYLLFLRLWKQPGEYHLPTQFPVPESRQDVQDVRPEDGAVGLVHPAKAFGNCVPRPIVVVVLVIVVI